VQADADVQPLDTPVLRPVEGRPKSGAATRGERFRSNPIIPSSARLLRARIEGPNRLDHRQPRTDRTLRVILVRQRVAEVGEQAVAEVLGDVAAEALDGGGRRAVIGGGEVAVVLGIELGAQRRRPDEIAEQDGELAALALSRDSCL